MTEQPKRRGRPPTGKRGNFTFRVTAALRDALKAAAAASGRSVSEEVELRLEQSFDREAIVQATLDAHEKRMEEAFKQDMHYLQMLNGPMGRLDS